MQNMIRHYFYAENEQQLGPFTVEELKSKRIKKSTLVWTDGMKNWEIALHWRQCSLSKTLNHKCKDVGITGCRFSSTGLQPEL